MTVTSRTHFWSAHEPTDSVWDTIVQSGSELSIQVYYFNDTMHFSKQVASNIDFLMNYLPTNSDLSKFYIRSNLLRINYVKNNILVMFTFILIK